MTRKPDSPTQPPWVRWLQARGDRFWLFVTVLAVTLLVTFVLTIEERTLALVAGTCFVGLLLHLLRRALREWGAWEGTERGIAVVFSAILVVAAAANFTRAMLRH